MAWRGIPGYNVIANQTQQNLVQILEGGDVNKDGYADFLFSTPGGTSRDVYPAYEVMPVSEIELGFRESFFST